MNFVHTAAPGIAATAALALAQYARRRQVAETELSLYVQVDGTVAFRSPAHIPIAARP
jgi:hypothetical protein